MREFDFRCPNCGFTVTLSINEPPSSCPNEHCYYDSPLKRVFNFYAKPMFRDHFNLSTGRYLTSEHQLSETLKVQSEEMSYRMGQEVDYQPISHLDMADPAAHGVTEEGLETTRKVHYDSTHNK